MIPLLPILSNPKNLFFWLSLSARYIEGTPIKKIICGAIKNQSLISPENVEGINKEEKPATTVTAPIIKAMMPTYR